jgi:hypothetical protein
MYSHYGFESWKLCAFSFRVADSTVYTIGYKSLDEARKKMSARYEAVLELAATTATIKMARRDGFGGSDDIQSRPVWTPDRKQIVASLATKAEGATTQSERYVRTQCLLMAPDDLPRLLVILAKIERAGYIVSRDGLRCDAASAEGDLLSIS